LRKIKKINDQHYEDYYNEINRPSVITGLIINNSSSEVNNKTIDVGMRLRIDQLTSIDTKQQRYGVKGIIDIDWNATKVDIINFQNQPYYYEPEFCPQIDTRNDVSGEYNNANWDNKHHYKIVSDKKNWYTL